MLAGAVVSSEGSTGEGLLEVVERVQFLVGCWTEGFSFLLVVGWWLPSFLCYVTISSMPVYFIEASKRERVNRVCSKMEVIILSNEFTEVTSITFVILFMQSKSLDPAHSRREEHKGANIGRQRSLGDILEAGYKEEKQ